MSGGFSPSKNRKPAAKTATQPHRPGHTGPATRSSKPAAKPSERPAAKVAAKAPANNGKRVVSPDKLKAAIEKVNNGLWLLSKKMDGIQTAFDRWDGAYNNKKVTVEVITDVVRRVTKSLHEAGEVFKA